MKFRFLIASLALIFSGVFACLPALAQEVASPIQEQQPVLDAGSDRRAITGQSASFDATDIPSPDSSPITNVLWNFGDGTQVASPSAAHIYQTPGSYLVTLTVTTENSTYSDTAEFRVFDHLIILVSDGSAPANQLELHQQRAAQEGVLLRPLIAKGSGPEVLIEEELTGQLRDIRSDIGQAHLIIMWTSGGVGANVLTKFAQQLHQAEQSPSEELLLSSKGIVLLSEKTPFAVLAPAAQSAFDQLRPSYTFLARPQVLDLLLSTTTAEEASSIILNSPLEYRLLGTFSARTVSDLGLTNFMSFGINFLINRGVPVGSIILILMLPVIATILAFARQAIGIKAFGLITPAMTTVSFLVMGLRYGLIVFATILLAGTLTRLVLRKLRLLYLPRMALVLTSVSLALLLLLGLGVANDRNAVLSFSIFPALILTILAEHFIAAQFKSGLRAAFTVTAWTLVLATVCYFIVSSELFRTLIISYPELILLAIPFNLILGQWSGLRLTEYIRFRQLLRHGQVNS
ncbi:MAG: 7TM domain-containing protein [bacterium]